METPETNDLNYAQLWQLLHLIDQNWPLFENYFLPKKVWKAKASEISQIRNRAAHFRSSHSDDLLRIEGFLRDIDKGFWRFCTSFNDLKPDLPPDSDVVTSHFLHLDHRKRGGWEMVKSKVVLKIFFRLLSNLFDNVVQNFLRIKVMSSM